MVLKKINDKNLKYFYSDYEIKNPILIMFFMLITCGLYLIYWFYKMNIDLERIDDSAPDSRRGVIILILLPPTWYIFYLIFKYLIFPNETFLVKIIAILGALIISFLALEYMYEFCKSFGKVTLSNGFIWYLFIYPGYFAIILYFLDFLYTIPLIFFSIIAIPAMQAFINTRAIRSQRDDERFRFNYSAKANSD